MAASGRKVCKRCGVSKPLEAFWKNKSCWDGRQYYCIECLKKYPNRRSAMIRYESKHVRVRVEGVCKRILRARLAEVARNAVDSRYASSNATMPTRELFGQR